MFSRAWISGAAAATGLQIAARRLPAGQQIHAASAGLVGAALLYVVGAARAGSTRQLGWCIAGVVPFTAVAASTMRTNPQKATRVLAAGWLAHAFWDWGHERVHGNAVPSWYAEMCQGFDVLLAAMLTAQTLPRE